MKKTADSLIHTNQEYQKLKHGKPDGTPPRETPSSQGPGRTGYGKQILDEWTTEELRTYAHGLGIDEYLSMDRDALQSAIEAHDATRHRLDNPPED